MVSCCAVVAFGNEVEINAKKAEISFSCLFNIPLVDPYTTRIYTGDKLKETYFAHFPLDNCILGYY